MQLVEREREMKLVGMLHQECLLGNGAAVVVRGPVASGKTELLHTVAEGVHGPDCLVLTAAGSRTEQSLPFSVMAQLFEPVSFDERYADQVEEIINLERCTRVAADTPVEEAERLFAPIFQALWALLNTLASHRPVLLFVDDAHLVDEPSARGLLFLARRLRFSRVLLMMTEAADPYRINELFATDLLRQRHCHQIRLRPLSPHGVTELLCGVLGDEWGHLLGARCHAVSGGNPLLVRALMEDHLDGLGRPELLGGEAYREAVLACLHRSTPLVRSVASAMAVLGGAPPGLLYRIIGETPEAVDRAEETLDQMGLTAAGGFRLRAGEQAVTDHIPLDERVAMQLDAATLLHDDAAPAPEVARHLLAAGRRLPRWAVPVLRQTAATLVRQDEIDRAVACLELAVRGSESDCEQGSIMAALLKLEWRTEMVGQSRWLPRLLELAAQGSLTREDAGVLLRHLLWEGDFRRAEDLLQRLADLPAGHGAPDDAMIEFVRVWVAYAYPSVAGRVPAANLSTRTAPELRTSLLHQAAHVLAASLAGLADDLTISQAEKFLEACPLQDLTVEPLTQVLNAVMAADRLPLAARWCDHFMMRAARRKAPVWEGVLASTRAAIALRQGDLELAKEQATRGLARIPPKRWGTQVGSPLATLLEVNTLLGEFAEAAELLTHEVPPATFQTRFGLQYLYARGRYYLAVDRLHAALGEFQLCGELATSWQVDSAGAVPWRLGLAETYAWLGDRASAERWAQEQLDRAGRGSRARGLALRLLASLGDDRERTALLGEAVDIFRACGDRYHLNVALDDLRVPAAAGSGQSLGAAPAGARAKGPAEPLEPLEPPFTVLSEAELRVAELAVRGYSNRKIAMELFITVSTVEQHLTRTYRKLKVDSRSALPARLKLLRSA
jgi:DNA-binding CsgD family transcriptional regulator